MEKKIGSSKVIVIYREVNVEFTTGIAIRKYKFTHAFVVSFYEQLDIEPIKDWDTKSRGGYFALTLGQKIDKIDNIEIE